MTKRVKEPCKVEGCGQHQFAYRHDINSPFFKHLYVAPAIVQEPIGPAMDTIDVDIEMPEGSYDRNVLLLKAYAAPALLERIAVVMTNDNIDVISKTIHVEAILKEGGYLGKE